MADEKKIIEIQVPLSDAIASISQLTAKIEELKKMEGLEAEAREQNNLAIKEYTRQRRVLINEAGKEIQGIQESMGSYQKLQTEYTKAALKAKNLAIEQGAGSVEAIKAADAANKMQEQLKEADAMVGQHHRNIGNYKDALEGLPGPIGNAVSSVKQLGVAFKALLANPVALVIAAIVGALALMYKAFTSTDEGATKLAGVMKALGNIFDVVLDRVVSFYKALWSLITLDFDGLKKNATDAFSGIASSIRDAAQAGYEYEQVMDGIADRESASLIRSAKLRAEIERLKNASKDSNLPIEERIRLNDLAMKKEIELNGIEKGFIRERFEAEKNNLAAMIQVNGMTIEQKRKQIDEWLKIDDRQIAQYQVNSDRFADFYNKNEDAFKALQKLKADDFQQDAEFAAGTRRLQTESFRFRVELLAEEQKRLDDAAKKRKERLAEQKKERDDLRAENKRLVDDLNSFIINQAETDLEFSRLVMRQVNANVKMSLDEQYRIKIESLQEDMKIELLKNDLAVQSEEERGRNRLLIEQKYRTLSTEANAQYVSTSKEQAAQRIIQDNLFYADLELSLSEQRNRGVLDAKLKFIDAQKAAEIKAAEDAGRDTTKIEEYYAEQRKAIKREELKTQISAVGDAMGALASIFEESSNEYKILATAQALINTYLGITAALQTPGGIVAQIAAVVSAAATGFSAVRNIWKVKPGDKAPASGGSQVVEPAKQSLPPDTSSRISLPLSGVIGYSSSAAITSGAATSISTGAADPLRIMQNMPAPIVTVKDIDIAQKRVKVTDSLAKI